MHPMSSVNPFMFDNDGTSPDSPSWSNGGPDLLPQSMQADIVNSRMSAAHQFGQVTPPDDDASKALAAPSQPSQTAPVAQSMTAKSERARNAANQRHAKAKKARKESIRKVEDEENGEEDEVEDKRERYREKNRLAAAKCRAKKKMNTEDLEESARSATAQNNRLKAEERELRDLFSSLRDQALAHDPSQGCSCHAIHAYNMNKAQETARATMAFGPGLMPSPSQRSIDSASPSTVGATSRTQSFSGVRPQFGRNPTRAQSLASPMSFMPSTTADDMVRRALTVGDMGQSMYAFAPSTTDSGQQPSPVTANDPEGVEYLQGTPEGQKVDSAEQATMR